MQIQPQLVDSTNSESLIIDGKVLTEKNMTAEMYACVRLKSEENNSMLWQCSCVFSGVDNANAVGSLFTMYTTLYYTILYNTIHCTRVVQY